LLNYVLNLKERVKINAKDSVNFKYEKSPHVSRGRSLIFRRSLLIRNVVSGYYAQNVKKYYLLSQERFNEMDSLNFQFRCQIRKSRYR